MGSHWPPELTRGNTLYNPRAYDAWCMGVILFFMMGIVALKRVGANFFLQLRQDPSKSDWINSDDVDKDGFPLNQGLWAHIMQEDFPRTKHAQQFINGLLNADPHKRMLTQDMATHPWLTEDLITHEQFITIMKGLPHNRIDPELTLSSVYATMDEGEFMTHLEGICLQAFQSIVSPTAEAVDSSGGCTQKFTQRHGHRVFVGVQPTFFTVEVLDDRRTLRCHWVNGAYAEWLTFFFSIWSRIKTAAV